MMRSAFITVAPLAVSANQWIHHSFCTAEGCGEQCNLISYQVDVCHPAGPSFSNKVIVNATHIIETDYGDSKCTNAIRSSISQRDVCTNQADEPGNLGKCGFTGPGAESTCWQDLTVMESKPEPEKGQGYRRWFCDPSCESCVFEEFIDLDSCVTTSSPLGPQGADEAYKQAHCEGGVLEITTFGNQTRDCTSSGTSSTVEIGKCVAGTFGTYEIWMETESCATSVLQV